jgi:hypothetical protein
VFLPPLYSVDKKWLRYHFLREAYVFLEKSKRPDIRRLYLLGLLPELR